MMSKLLWTLFVLSWTLCVESSTSSGTCFDFPGDSFINFLSDGFDNNQRIHYSFEVKTSQAEDALILFAQGDDDLETLYLRNGRLHYEFFNTVPSGVDGQFGGEFSIDQPANTGTWVTVHLYRLWRVADPRRQSSFVNKTGMEVVIDGQTYSDTDNLARGNIQLSPTVYFGGHLGDHLPGLDYFEGQIKNIREEKNGAAFDIPSLNYKSKVFYPCA